MRATHGTLPKPTVYLVEATDTSEQLMAHNVGPRGQGRDLIAQLIVFAHSANLHKCSVTINCNQLDAHGKQ
ncbi:MAG TPA: hypothetical protein VFH68_19265 [Polyangia bacterium]|jgi:transcriptional regulator with AAA-type ATPase domain|nr:hypothetical protein [Polyangia bacterium]